MTGSKMQYTFCTYFDRNYLYKGLTLYNSLSKVCPDFKLWILCFDDIVYDLLSRMKLKYIELISLRDFEDVKLLSIKNTRSQVEYYWTCTPSVPLYILQRYPSLEMITYLDADLFFYADPAPIFEEFADNSILITEHRYIKDVEYNIQYRGRYNVQFIIFRNNDKALECLRWWRDRCIEWCYFRSEDGKLGDQKYLDDWMDRFKGVKVLEHKGGGLAPWNIAGYRISKGRDGVFVDEDRLIFCHFHQLSILSNNKFDLVSGYRLRKEDVKLVYLPYIKALKESIEKVSGIEPHFNFGFSAQDTTLLGRINEAKRRMMGKYYVMGC